MLDEKSRMYIETSPKHTNEVSSQSLEEYDTILCLRLPKMTLELSSATKILTYGIASVTNSENHSTSSS